MVYVLGAVDTICACMERVIMSLYCELMVFALGHVLSRFVPYLQTAQIYFLFFPLYILFQYNSAYSVLALR